MSVEKAQETEQKDKIISEKKRLNFKIPKGK
jgi:hypothetical protein